VRSSGGWESHAHREVEVRSRRTVQGDAGLGQGTQRRGWVQFRVRHRGGGEDKFRVGGEGVG
jgi:hypothetical protein